MAMSKREKKAKKKKHERPPQQGDQLKQHGHKEARNRGVLVLQQRTQLIIEHAMQMGKATQNLLTLLAEAKYALASPDEEVKQECLERISRALDLIDGKP